MTNPWSSGWDSGYGEAYPPSGKTLIVHVYDENGNFIRVMPDWSVMPTFQWPINSGQGALEFQLARPWGSEGELHDDDALLYEDIVIGNVFKFFVYDRETVADDGYLLYQGRLTEYDSDLRTALVTGTLVPKTNQFVNRHVHDAVEFTDEDPSNMVDFFIDNGYMFGITRDPNDIILSGSLWSPTFERENVKSILDRIQQLAGNYWYYRLNADNTLTFNFSDVFDPDHTLVIGTHVAEQTRFHRSDMERKRRVYVYGAEEKIEETEFGLVRTQEAIYAMASDAGYEPETDPDIFPMELVYANSRITDAASAYRIANSLLTFYNQYFFESEVLVVDSNYDPLRGYDIESLKPGQVVQLRHPHNQFQFRFVGDHIIGDGHIIGGDWWAQVLSPAIIANVDYQWTHAIIRLQTRPNQVSEAVSLVAARLLLEETK